MYCAQKHNILHTVHQKCVLCTETQHFRDGTLEMCSVHREQPFPDRTVTVVFISEFVCFYCH